MAPPAYIFVVRHGNRLDVADKHWHLSSPTPYDPPLTYSGWVQSRAVGSQISALLRDRAVRENDAASPSGTPPRRPKRYRVVIHSSPFLRCIQTSIAISAGLMGRPSILAPAQRNLTPAQASQLADAGVTQSNGSPAKTGPRRTSVVGKKTVLRIDAFLGEWLSPTYFELITPPPGSVMMLASAKASLLKAEDYKSYPHLQARSHSNSAASIQPPTNHLWGGSPKPSPLSGQSLSAVDVSSASSSSLDSLGSMQSFLPKAGSLSPPPEVGAYEPPVPAFSMPKNAAIPAGYVNHAKDACVVVDYQWDSMRPPYDWGDGGELPEDWPDMHKRFKKGLQALVDWYTKADDPASAVTTEYMRPPETQGGEAEDEDDENVETVVILVSHGAGCNAMIGAITHKPALMDIPISSLSMAAIKPHHGRTNGAGHPPAGHRHNGSVSLHQTYDLILKASTDHLRSMAPTPNTSRSPSMANVFGGVGAGVARGRSSNSFSTPSGTNGTMPHADGHSRSSSVSSSLASIRRGLRDQAPSRGLGISVGSATNLPPGLSVGLWSPTPKPDPFTAPEDDETAVLDMAPSPRMKAKRPTTPKKHANGDNEEHLDQLAQLPARASPATPNGTNGSGGRAGPGLWLSGMTPPSSLAEAEAIHDQSPSKRRWTVTERS